MSTIHKHPGRYTREERLANEFPSFKREEPLSNEQLAEIRAKAQAQPQYNTTSADNAARHARLAEQTEKRRQEALKK
jgi:hypothetical protein